MEPKLILAGILILGLGLKKLPELIKKYKHFEQRKKIESELPFATRYFVSILEAGVPIERAITNLGENNFGELSKKLKRTSKRVEKGGALERALFDVAKESKSENFLDFASVVSHTIKTGVSKRAIESIALLSERFESVAENRYNDFTSKSQLLLTLHITITALLPASVLFLAGISSAMKSEFLSKFLLSILFVLVFPLIAAIEQIIQKVIQPC